MRPVNAMAALQALYDGTWDSDGRPTAEPTDPVEPHQGQSGHPPIHPLDRAATPEVVGKLLSEDQRRVYQIVWDYEMLAEAGRLSHRSARLECRVEGVEGLPADLRVCFEGLDAEGFNGEAGSLLLAGAPGAGQAAEICGSWLRVSDMALSSDIRPLGLWREGLDGLIRRMERLGLGRPSTYAAILDRLMTGGLIACDPGGPVRLTSAGLAAALACERREPRLSDPRFTTALAAELDLIAGGGSTPAEVLARLTPDLAPGVEAGVDPTRIWSSLSELADRLYRAQPERVAGMVAPSPATG